MGINLGETRMDEIAAVTGCHCHEDGTLCPSCAEQIRRLIRGQQHTLALSSDPRPDLSHQADPASGRAPRPE